MTPNEALHEILRAFEAWDNDEPFEPTLDPERSMNCDGDFVVYMAAVAEGAATALGRSERPA